MKIVKSFEDQKFFQRRYRGSELSGEWLWGFGDDGELYCRCTQFGDDRWRRFDEVGWFDPTMEDMKRIVKEFGHLVVFT